MRKFILSALTPMFLFVACVDDVEERSEVESCPGEEITVEGEAFCVFIEEGFLTSDCPEGFPVGRIIKGVVVCSSGQDLPEDAVGDELDRRGLSKSDEILECVEDLDCPQPSPFFGCELNVAHQILASGGCNEENRCEIDGDETFSDCGEEGAVCVDGECTEIPESENIEILAEAHQACETVADCRAFYTGCGSCQGECAAVNQAFEGSYIEALDCTNFEGPVCDFDCHPDAGQNELACEEGACVILEI